MSSLCLQVGYSIVLAAARSLRGMHSRSTETRMSRGWYLVPKRRDNGNKFGSFLGK